MDNSLSSEPQPADYPVKPTIDTVLAAAAMIDDTETGSAAMVRDAAWYLRQSQTPTPAQRKENPE